MSDELQRELTEQTALADAGEAAAVFLHELGNVLNNIQLQARLMQQEAPANLQQRLADTCRNISSAALHMKYLAQFRQGRRIKPYQVDLNAVVRSVAPALENRLAPDLPPIMNTVADLKRVLTLLIRNAALPLTPSPSPPGGEGKGVRGEKAARIVLSTFLNGEQVTLRVQCVELTIPDEEIEQLFEPFKLAGRTPDSLELSICKELVWRARGQMIAAKDEQGSLFYTVSWPAV